MSASPPPVAPNDPTPVVARPEPTVAQEPPVVTSKATTTTTVDPPFWQGVLADIHVNASGLVLFTCLSIGVIKPAWKPQCTEIAALAGTYLFMAAKGK